jgi:hypothetical protein
VIDSSLEDANMKIQANFSVKLPQLLFWQNRFLYDETIEILSGMDRHVAPPKRKKHSRLIHGHFGSQRNAINHTNS